MKNLIQKNKGTQIFGEQKSMERLDPISEKSDQVLVKNVTKQETFLSDLDIKKLTK